MLRRCTALWALALLAACARPPSQPPASPRFFRAAAPIAGRYVVVLRAGDLVAPALKGGGAASVRSVAAQKAASHGGTLGYVYSAALRGFSAELTEAEARALADDPEVDFVEEDGVVSATGQQA